MPIQSPFVPSLVFWLVKAGFHFVAQVGFCCSGLFSAGITGVCHPYLALKTHTKVYTAQLDRFSCSIQKQNTTGCLTLAYNPKTWEAQAGGRL